MAKNRVRELRKSRGWTVEELAERIGHSHTHVSRIERGERNLTVDVAERIAEIMGEPVTEVLGFNAGRPQPAAGGGFAEDAVPYDVKTDGLPIRARADANIDPWVVKTSVLDRLGIGVGTVIFVDISADAVESIKPLQAVIAQVYDPGELTKATTVLRQFVPPSLLITNSSRDNALPLDIDKGEAVIKGIVVGHYHGL